MAPVSFLFERSENSRAWRVSLKFHCLLWKELIIMTVKALLNQLYDELKSYQDRADRYEHIRDYHYEYGAYASGIKYELMRVDALNEADNIIKIIKGIQKRVS